MMPPTPTHAVLSEYASDAWLRRRISGPAVAAVVQWLARIEARPRLPGPVSGKPLAWLELGVETAPPGPPRILRSVGLLTDVHRVLDREVSAEELDALWAIFARHGRPVGDTGTG